MPAIRAILLILRVVVLGSLGALVRFRPGVIVMAVAAAHRAACAAWAAIRRKKEDPPDPS